MAAIILGGRINALTIIRSLAQRNISVILIYNDPDDYAASSKYLKKAYHFAHPESNEKKFLSELLELRIEYKNSVIFPVEDEYLSVISKNLDTLREHFLVSCNNAEVIIKLVNKRYIYDIVSSLGLPVPRNISTSNEQEALNFVKEIGFPCLMKPSKSHTYFKIFGKKMVKVFDIDSLILEMNRTVKEGLVAMIQEYIPGGDGMNYSYWGYRTNGKFYAEATAKKVRNDPPDTGSPRVQVTKYVPELIPVSRKILEALDYCGYANVEFKKDPRTNEFKFMEINPRINRCMLQAIAGGIDYPWIIYNHLTKGDLPEPLTCEEGIYWIDLERDIMRNFQYRKIENYTLKEYLYPYFHKHVFPVFNLRDLRPTLKRISSFIKK